MVLVGKGCLRNEHLVNTYTQCTGLSQNLPFTPPCQKKSLCQKFGKDGFIIENSEAHGSTGKNLESIESTRKY